MSDKIEVEKFKELILDMYRGFPNWIYRKMVEDVIKISTVRQKLIDTNFLIREPHIDQGKKYYMYMLGPNALSLVSAWKTEEYTKETKNLTQRIVGLTLLLIYLVILSIVLPLQLHFFGVI